MTAFRLIGDSEVAENAPVTALLVSALRDNVLAIAEGDATAPDIAATALDQPPVGTNDSYQDVSGSRAVETSYQNTTGQSIEVSVVIEADGGGFAHFQVSTDDSNWVTIARTTSLTGISVTATVAQGEFYRVTLVGTSTTISFDSWVERRP